jgi:hypothetical protein
MLGFWPWIWQRGVPCGGRGTLAAASIVAGLVVGEVHGFFWLLLFLGLLDGGGNSSGGKVDTFVFLRARHIVDCSWGEM